jgi:single-strand DNA-binding protein
MSARSLNRVTLIGNLTRDPELRYTPSGTAVCTFGMATNRSWTPNDGGERQEETEYHRIVAWAKLGEICSQLLFKGRKVYVEGRLQTRKWTGQDGMERETTEIVIDNMIALGAPKGGSQGYGGDDTGDDDYGSSYSQVPAEVQEEAKGNIELPADEGEPMPTKKSAASKKKEEVDADDIPF